MTHPVSHDAAVFLPGVGRADHCQGYGKHVPAPLRFVWHHLLPISCGGRTVPENLVQLCDGCHYSVHVLLWQLGQGIPLTAGTRKQRNLAHVGYSAAIDLGTVNLIPKEA